MNPKVSIIIPVYNGANYVKEAIDSALSQTYDNIEIIVVNDGSNDNGETEKIIFSYQDKVKYISKKNGGVSSALNAGIRAMTGEYFSWLSHDDMYSPEKVSSQIALLKKYQFSPNLIALCAAKEIDCNSKEFSIQRNFQRFETDKKIGHLDALWDLIQNGAFNGCALLIPKIAFEKCGLFDENLRYAQDKLMWIKIFQKNFMLVYDNKKLVYNRVHKKQLTQTGRDLYQKDSFSIAQEIMPNLLKISNTQRNFLFEFAKQNARMGNVKVLEFCIENGKKANLLSPKQLIELQIYNLYGRVRPKIKKIYYMTIKKVQTQ